MKIALLTRMLKSFPEGSLLPLQNAFRKTLRLALRWLLSRAFMIGLAALALVGCAGSVPGLHIGASYDGQLKSVASEVQTTRTGEPVISGSNFIPSLTEK
jgi:hypothetical protein